MKPLPTQLHASAPAPLSFAPKESIRAFRLRRDAGDVLVYSSPTVVGDAAFAGVERVLLNHWHEAEFGAGEEVAAALGATLTVDAGDAGHVAGAETFADSTPAGDDLVLIPIPGHTPGATAFLWSTEGRRVLFTGDSLFVAGGEWVGAVLGSSDRDAYIASLERLRDVEFDLLVPWIAGVGEPFAVETDPADARRRIDTILARVRGGADR